MKKIKFLSLGAAALLATGLISSPVNAADQNVEQFHQDMTQHIQNVIKIQKDTGFLKESSEVVVKFELGENRAQLYENVCRVNLSFDKDGNSPTLSEDVGIQDATKFMNPVQKEMMREFIALHESFHCEFSTISNPIHIEGKSYSFNEKVNYYLKDINTIPLPGFGKLGYMDTLDENFADVAATGVMLKKYGKDDPNLQFVLKATQTQRHVNYLTSETDNHFTHIALKEAIDGPSADKLINAKDGDEYRKIALEVANKSVQKLMAERKDLTEEMFTPTTLQMSILTRLTRTINYQLANAEQRKTFVNKTDWKEGIKNGLSTELAEAYLKGEDISQKKLAVADFSVISLDENKMKLVAYASELMSEKSVNYFLNRDMQKFPEFMTEFKEAVYAQNNTKEIEFEKMDKGELVNKMLQLRSKFLQDTQTISNTMKIK